MIDSKRMRGSLMSAWWNILRIILSLALGILTGAGSAAAQPSKTASGASVLSLDAAWAAFNKGSYDSAIRQADICIDDFAAKAVKEQAALQAAREPVPPVGATTSSDSKRILSRSALNDVATAYFVKGRSAEYLFKKTKNLRHKQIAEEAYGAAMKLTYARCWDPQGWFWSPSEAASDRLASLKQ